MAMQGQPPPPSPPPQPPPPPTPPATAGKTLTIPTCANQILTQMDVMSLYDQTFDRNLSLYRSMKMFMVSYVGYDQLCPQLYQQKLDEYIQAMQFLYAVPQVPNTLIQTVETVVSHETYHMTIDVINFRHRPDVQSARIRFTNQILGEMPLDLDPILSRQNQQTAFILTYDQLRNFRANNFVMIITLEFVLVGQQTIDVGSFNLEFGHIHAEGFYNWIEFSNHDSVLLNVVFECQSEMAFTPEWGVNFHLHSLIWALQHRIEMWRNTNYRPLHRSVAHKPKAVLYRDLVDPNSVDAFWPDDPTAAKLQRVRYMDLQMGLHPTDYFSDKGCLCSEWCNWVAFFHHNPIYRFLFVRHSQIYLRYKANKPELYMYAVAKHIFNVRLNLANNVSTPDLPLLRLMADAIVYKERFYTELFLKNPLFQQQYNNCQPQVNLLIGATYLILRSETPLFDLCNQSDTEPFGENCINNFIQFCTTLGQLHRSITPYYVDHNNRQIWPKELESVQRHLYSRFLPFCCIHAFGRMVDGSDILFDIRTVNSVNRIANPFVNKCRQQVLRFGLDGNPLNSRIKCQTVIYSLVGCHRFVRKFEETMGKAVYNGLPITANCYEDVDRTLKQQIQPTHCDFYVDQQWLTDKNIQDLATPLSVCYTLKLYALNCDLQHYFAGCVIALYNRGEPFDAFSELTSIFDNQLVEQTLRSYHSLQLFTFNDNMTIDAFYNNYWGQADHWSMQNPTRNQCLDSAFFQYKRQYFWWRNGGEQRNIFVQILRGFENTMNDILNETDTVFQDYILTTVFRVQSTYEYASEVIDYLVYYLVKAVCYAIFRTVCEMHKRIHALKIPELVRHRRLYALCRPGWIPIFRTLRTAVATLDAVGQKYSLFDDESTRIADVIIETQLMVRQTYESHFFWFGQQMFDEIKHIHGLPAHGMDTPNRTIFGVIHLANCFAFMAAFINDFRKSYRPLYKRFMNKILDQSIILSANLPWQMMLQACQPIIVQYLNDPNAIEMGQPLMHPIWQNYMMNIIANLNAETEQTMNIDLAAADI